MPQLAHRSVADRLDRRVQQFSDELLAEEQRCFTAMMTLGIVGAAAGVSRLNKAFTPVQSVPRLVGDPGLTLRLRAVCQDVQRRMRVPVTALVMRATTMALDAIGDELGHCEAGLPARYRGTADEAMLVARAVEADYVAAALASYTGGEPGVVLALLQNIGAQMALGARHGDDLAAMRARLFAVDRAKVPGRNARGVWFGMVSDSQANARGVTIQVANRLRTRAMAAFNDVAEAR